VRLSHALIAGLLALAGCQTTPDAPPAAMTDTGHLTHQFTDVSLITIDNVPGYTHAFSLVEVFRTGAVGVRLTGSRMCAGIENACVDQTYDIAIPANSTKELESRILSDDPANEAYTETYFGRDDNGNDVVVVATFRAADYQL
jgi:hypothetical protein